MLTSLVVLPALLAIWTQKDHETEIDMTFPEREPVMDVSEPRRGKLVKRFAS